MQSRTPLSAVRIEAWRTLGFDYAAHSVPIPSDAPEAFLEGYRERLGPRRTVKLDRFELKWLHLRHGALKRSLIVQPEVTPEFLRAIDVPTCPVTLVTLTHATRADTDWSIDRLDNDGAYARGNLAVMSTRANRAKGTKGLDEVCALAMRDSETDGLTPREWMRFGMLMCGPCTAGTAAASELPPFPLVTKLPPHVVRRWDLQLQHIIHMATRSRENEKAALHALRQVWADSAAMDRLKLLVEMVRKYRAKASYEYDVWLEKRVQERFVRWFNAVPASRRPMLRQAVAELAGGEAFQEPELRGWSLDARGRMVG